MMVTHMTEWVKSAIWTPVLRLHHLPPREVIFHLHQCLHMCTYGYVCSTSSKCSPTPSPQTSHKFIISNVASLWHESYTATPWINIPHTNMDTHKHTTLTRADREKRMEDKLRNLTDLFFSRCCCCWLCWRSGGAVGKERKRRVSVFLSLTP